VQTESMRVRPVCARKRETDSGQHLCLSRSTVDIFARSVSLLDPLEVWPIRQCLSRLFLAHIMLRIQLLNDKFQPDGARDSHRLSNLEPFLCYCSRIGPKSQTLLTAPNANRAVSREPDVLDCAPHFEKMLYDNAQLARVYLHAPGRSRAMDSSAPSPKRS
jgi:hypothetical protein